MGMLSAILAGAGQVAGQEHERAIDARVTRRKEWGDALKWVADPNSGFPSEQQAMAAQFFMQMAGVSPLKPLPKDLESALEDFTLGIFQKTRPIVDAAQAAQGRADKATLGVPELIPPPGETYAPSMPGVDLEGITGPFRGPEGAVKPPVGGLIPEAVATPPPPGVEQPYSADVQASAYSLEEFAAETGEDPTNPLVIQKYRDMVATLRGQRQELGFGIAEAEAISEAEYRQRAAQAEKFLASLPGFDQMPNREKAYWTAVAYGKNPSGAMLGAGVSNIPGVVDGAEIRHSLPLDAYNKPVEEGQKYAITRDQLGEPVSAFPVENPYGTRSTSQWFVDDELSEPNQPVFSVAYFDRQGNLMNVVRNMTPPASLLPTVRRRGLVVTDERGNQHIQFITETTEKVIPGVAKATPPPGEAGPPAGVQPGLGPRYEGVGRKPLTDVEARSVIYSQNAARHLRSMRDLVSNDRSVLIRDMFGLGKRYDALRTEVMDNILRPRTGAAMPRDEREWYKGNFPNWKDLVAEWLGEPGVVSMKFDMYIGLMDYLVAWREGTPFPEQLKMATNGSEPVYSPPPGSIPEGAEVFGDGKGNFKYTTDGGKTWHNVQ